MIKAVLFHFDGMLTIDKIGALSIANAIARHTGLPLELVRQSFARKKAHPALFDYVIQTLHVEA